MNLQTIMRTAAAFLVGLVLLVHGAQTAHMRGSLMALNENTARNHAKSQWDVAQTFQRYLAEGKGECNSNLLPVHCQINSILRKIDQTQGNSDQILGLRQKLLKFEIDEQSELAAERRDVLVEAKTGRVDIGKLASLQTEIANTLIKMEERLAAIKNRHVQDMQVASEKAVLAEQVVKRMQTNLDRYIETHKKFVQAKDADLAQVEKLKKNLGKASAQVGGVASQAVKKVSTRAKDTYTDSAIREKVLDSYLQATNPLK